MATTETEKEAKEPEPKNKAIPGVLTASKTVNERHFRVLCEQLGYHRGKKAGVEEVLCKDGEKRMVQRYDWSEGGWPGYKRDPLTREIIKDSIITLTQLTAIFEGEPDLDRLFRIEAIVEVSWVDNQYHGGQWQVVSHRNRLWLPRQAMQADPNLETRRN